MQADAKGSILALDVGDKRIGVAIASHAARLAEPLVTLENDRLVFTKIEELVKQHRVNDFVVGLPRNLNGDDTPQTEVSKAFAKQLQNYFGDQKTHLFDEMGTSLMAKDKLKAQKAPHTKADVDKYAASFILQGYLDGEINEK